MILRCRPDLPKFSPPIFSLESLQAVRYIFRNPFWRRTISHSRRITEYTASPNNNASNVTHLSGDTMKNVIRLVVMLVALSMMAAAQEDEHLKPLVIPTPQQITGKNIRFKISGGTKIVLGSNSKQEQFDALQLNDEFGKRNETQLKVVAEDALRKLPATFIFIGGPSSEYGRYLLKERKGSLLPEMKEEGYYLDVDANSVVIIAASEKGRFYGVMTLLQMLRRERKSVFVDGVTIRDFPLEKIRGITDDISRGQVSNPENFKKIIRFLARYKLNTYSPYLEDMFLFNDYPLIGKGRGALTSAEVKELDAYAKKYYVDLIPIFETLGHWENILARPEYVSYAEFPGAHTLNVSDEKVYTMLDDMIRELCASFSAPYFNMAADESWDVGLGANRERVSKSDLGTVHAEHYKRVAEMIRAHGKRPMMYGDIILNIPTILDKIPNDITIVDWHYDPGFGYSSPVVFKKAGFPFIASPAVWNFTGPFPDYFGTFANIRNFNRDGFANGAVGLLTSNWNDYGGEELRELNYYGYAWTAQCGWQPEKANVDEFNKAFFATFFGTTEPEKLQSIYAILSSPSNQFSWHELWRHPMLPLRPESKDDGYLPIVQRLESIKSTMPFVLSQLSSARRKLSENEDHLKYLEFVARLNLWFVKKIEAGETIKQLSASAGGAANKDSIAALIINISSDVLRDLSLLKNDFEGLWLSTNKAAGLELLLMRYDRQYAYWQEKIDEVKHGLFWVNPEIESSWIYCPTSDSVKDDLRRERKFYFRKPFIVVKGVRSATLQLIGDSYVKISVNGKYAGEVIARRSLSLGVEHQRVKAFDILPLLTDSINVICAEAQSFDSPSWAGVNVYCELQFTDGSSKKIESDTTWKVSAMPVDNWTSLSFADSSWMHSIVKTYPSTIVRPNFAGGRSSWIER